MSVKMFHDNVLVEPEEEEMPSTKGGLLLPESAQKKAMLGKVKAVGPGARSTQTGQLIPTQVKKGDRVYFRPWTATEFYGENDEKLMILKEIDLFGMKEDSCSA